MKSQQFRNTKTGETVTQVPLSQIADFEEYNGPRVFYSAARNVVLDAIDPDAEVGYYSLKNLAETVAEAKIAPVYTCGDITQICASVDGRYFGLCDSYKTPHAEILRRVRAFIEAE